MGQVPVLVNAHADDECEVFLLHWDDARRVIGIAIIAMKKHLEKKREADLLKQYPIKGRAEGWYFRLKETSNNAWAVEGVDVWGRRVYFSGGDPEALLADAETESERILAGVGGG